MTFLYRLIVKLLTILRSNLASLLTLHRPNITFPYSDLDGFIKSFSDMSDETMPTNLLVRRNKLSHSATIGE